MLERSGEYSTTWAQPSCVRMLPSSRRKRSWHWPIAWLHSSSPFAENEASVSPACAAMTRRPGPVCSFAATGEEMRWRLTWLRRNMATKNGEETARH